MTADLGARLPSMCRRNVAVRVTSDNGEVASVDQPDTVDVGDLARDVVS